MKRLILCAIFGVLGMAPAMFADVIDYLLNVNGTDYCDTGSGTGCANVGLPTGSGDSSTLNTSFDTTGNGGAPYGLGSVNLTFNPGAPGSYNVGLWLFEELTPNSGYDEYGSTGGSLAAGESWQIDVPDYDAGGDPNTSATGTVIANTEANTLSNANDVPGGVDSITGTCPSPNCNDYTSLALSQDFTLGAGQEEDLSFTVSTTAPTSGFYLEQIDPGEVTGTPATYYYSVTANTVSVCTADCSTVPEPKSWVPLLAFAGILVFAVWRRSAKA
jgi:hypothetical protein